MVLLDRYSDILPLLVVLFSRIKNAKSNRKIKRRYRKIIHCSTKQAMKSAFNRHLRLITSTFSGERDILLSHRSSNCGDYCGTISFSQEQHLSIPTHCCTIFENFPPKRYPSPAVGKLSLYVTRIYQQEGLLWLKMISKNCFRELRPNR